MEQEVFETEEEEEEEEEIEADEEEMEGKTLFLTNFKNNFYSSFSLQIWPRMSLQKSRQLTTAHEMSCNIS